MIKAWKFDPKAKMPPWVSNALSDGRIFYKPTSVIDVHKGVHVPSVDIMPANTSWVCHLGEYLYLERGQIFRAPSANYLLNMFGEGNVDYATTFTLSTRS